MTKNDTTRHEKALLIDFIRYQRKETKHFIRCYRIKNTVFYFVVSNTICTFAAKSKYMEKDLFRAIIAENQEYIGRIPLVQRPLDL